jgi:hypothetical protein
LCVRWLLDGEIEHRWSDKGARDWNHNGVFRLRAYINKHYTNAIPVVVGQGNANQTWFSFDKTHSNLVAAATGTNTVSSPALQIIEGPINGSTQEMRIVYSMNMIRLDVVSDEGREPRLVLTEYRLSD